MSAMYPISGFGPDDSGDPRNRKAGGRLGGQSERRVEGQAGLEPPEGQASAPERADQSQSNYTTTTGVPIGRRAAARLRLALPARLVSLYGTHRCILIDLSTTGAQLGMEMPLATSENAILEIAGKELFCDIVRVSRGPHGGTNGVKFDPELEDQDVLDVRRFSETYKTNELRAIRSEVRAWVNGSA